MTLSFGRDVLQPSVHRAPTVRGYPTAAAVIYPFICAACDASIRVDVFRLANGQQATVLGSENATAVQQHFDVNLVGKSHDGGWPRFAVETCSHCRSRYLIYAGVQEPANGYYIITIQGIVEIQFQPRAV